MKWISALICRGVGTDGARLGDKTQSDLGDFVDNEAKDYETVEDNLVDDTNVFK